MADEAEKAELVGKLNALATRFNGGTAPTRETWAALFAKYDRDGDKLISAGELETLLEDADVGTWLTRSMWVSNIVYELDNQRGDRDGKLSLPELMKVIDKLAGPGSLLEGGVRRVKEQVADFVPSVPSFELGSPVVWLGIGLLFLWSTRK